MLENYLPEKKRYSCKNSQQIQVFINNCRVATVVLIWNICFSISHLIVRYTIISLNNGTSNQ